MKRPSRHLRYTEAAKLGCYVYCYLRADNSLYYVGVASNATRPIDKRHTIKPPADRDRIRVLRSGLSWEEALRWEIFYIARFGRKDIGTGYLRNLTNGGDGAVGCVPSRETREKMAEAQRGRKHTSHTKQKMAESAKGKTWSVERRQAASLARKGKPNGSKGRKKSKSSVLAMVTTQSAASAEKLKVDLHWYASLPKLEKIRARRASVKRSIFGDELVEYMQTRHDREGGGRPKKH